MMRQCKRQHFLGSAVALGAGAAVWPFSGALGAPTKTTQSEPEGFFTLGRQKDHWWLITPRRKPFFSLGVNHIDPATMRYPENIPSLAGEVRREHGQMDQGVGGSESEELGLQFRRPGPGSDRKAMAGLTHHASSSRFFQGPLFSGFEHIEGVQGLQSDGVSDRRVQVHWPNRAPETRILVDRSA